MNECVWIGPAKHAPAGWIVVPTLEAFLSSSYHPSQIAIVDQGATLREADFLAIYQHSPLSKLTRSVGPWRAGIGRTDPNWPRLTTWVEAPPLFESLDSGSELPLPLTADYDQISRSENSNSNSNSLRGISVCIRITDQEFRQMWEETLRAVGAEVVDAVESVMVLLTDEAGVSSLPILDRRHGGLILRLTTAPWLIETSASEVAFSASVSPALVLRYLQQQLLPGGQSE